MSSPVQFTMSSQGGLNDIKRWLKDVLFEQQLTDFTVDVVGNSEKGDGYIGDVVFVHVDGKTEDNKSRSFDLVLKCSKKDLREKLAVKEAFQNEIYMYSCVFPTFKQFQVEKGIEKPFNSLPPYFGKFVSDNMEVVILQNMKEYGYKLYERSKPLNSDHLKLLLREYGKWHAISGAMQDQRPEVFKQLVDGLQDTWKKYGNYIDMRKLVTEPIEDMYNLIKEDASPEVARKLYDFKNEAEFINTQLIYDRSHFSVINHGDNWNNNFMFKYKETDGNEPIKVAILDWQIARFASPVTDISYFLYVCVSREDLSKFEDLLREYHTSFSNYLRKLGSDPDKIFPYSKFLEDWKMLAKFGIMMAMMVIRIAMSEHKEVKDLSESINNGEVNTTFFSKAKDENKLKERVLAVVEHAVAHGLI